MIRKPKPNVACKPTYRGIYHGQTRTMKVKINKVDPVTGKVKCRPWDTPWGTRHWVPIKIVTEVHWTWDSDSATWLNEIEWAAKYPPGKSSGRICTKHSDLHLALAARQRGF